MLSHKAIRPFVPSRRLLARQTAPHRSWALPHPPLETVTGFDLHGTGTCVCGRSVRHPLHRGAR